MCLTKIYKTQKGAEQAHLHPCIAKKEIKVYKMLYKMKDKKGREGKKGRSPFQDFVYEQGFQYSSEMRCSCNRWSPELNVHEGLHAYYDEHIAKNKLVWSDARIIIEMYIPIGAKYYKGIHGDIVSNHLIWY